MSANLDLVRSIYADWERGDFRRIDWADPQIEYMIVGEPIGGTSTGLDGMAVAWRGWLSEWEDYHAEASEYRVIDDGCMLVLGCMRGRGKLSGASGEMKIANVFHLRNGKVTKLVMYGDRDRALADLGLAPEDE
jgi:ketosteroid isomerase-like protein